MRHGQGFRTLEEAEAQRQIETEQDSGRAYVIEHRAVVLLNQYQYWTQADLDAIDALAKERSEAMAQHVD